MANKIIQNIVGGSRQSDIAKVCKALSVNMYPETQDATQAAAPSILRSIKGSELVLSMPKSTCRGLFRASRGEDGNPVMFAAYGDTVYIVKKVDGEFVYFAIGTVANGNGPIRFCETNGYGSAAPHLIVVDGANVYAVDTTLSVGLMSADWRVLTLPKRPDGDIIRPTHCAYLYGYLAVNDAGSDAFYLSYQYPFETEYEGGTDYDIFQTEERWGYDGQGFRVYAEWMPDNTLAIISNGSYLWTFGSRSFQCFSYNDDVNYPFSSPDNAAAAIGIRAVNSLCSLGTKVFWLGASDIGENGVFMGEGTGAKRISTTDMEREIAKMSNPDDALGQCWQENQHLFYAITFIRDNKTFVYDVAEGVWHNRSSFRDRYWRPQYACFFENRVFFGDLSTGALVCLAEKWTEWDGLIIQRRRIGGVIFSDYSPFYIDCLRLVVNNGQVDNPYRLPDPDMNPQVSIRYTWDGGLWSDEEIGCMGRVGRYDWTTDFWHLGMGKFFSIEVLCTEDIDFTIISAKIDAKGCNIF